MEAPIGEKVANVRVEMAPFGIRVQKGLELGRRHVYELVDAAIVENHFEDARPLVITDGVDGAGVDGFELHGKSFRKPGFPGLAEAET